MKADRYSVRRKQLKPAQAATLVSIAQDGRRRLQDRNWAMRLLRESGLDDGSLLGAAKATLPHAAGKNGNA